MQQSVLAAIFSDDRKELLIVKKRNIPVWVLPGGGIDPNETPEEAIVREVKEETGLNIRVIKKVGEYLPQNRLSNFTHLYECKKVSGKLTTGPETKDLNFFPLHQLPLKKIPHTFRYYIQDAHNNPQTLIQGKVKGSSYWMLIRFIFTHPILVLRFFLARYGFSINT